MTMNINNMNEYQLKVNISLYPKSCSIFISVSSTLMLQVMSQVIIFVGQLDFEYFL